MFERGNPAVSIGVTPPVVCPVVLPVDYAPVILPTPLACQTIGTDLR